MKDRINHLNQLFSELEMSDALNRIAGMYAGKITFATSLGPEDQVITDMVAGLAVRIFTLDTGRLFQETYDLLDITEKRYKLNIHICFPEAGAIEEMVRTRGINLFYENIDNRKLCCHLRKTGPLQRALKGMDVWITGLRREQSITRSELKVVEWDETNHMIKINPLIDWTNDQVWEYIHAHRLPYNALHQKGYPSIGCQPCTRAVLPGEDIRSGRWWWELPQFRECGIHVAKKK